MKEKNKRKGFTLVELLAVVVILGVLAFVAIPSVYNTLDSTKEKAFYASVSNIVREVQTSVIQDEKESCLYHYKGSDKNIESLSILVSTENGVTKYAVAAKRKGSKTKNENSIDTNDFFKTTTDKSTWIKKNNKDKASYKEAVDFLGVLYYLNDTNNLKLEKIVYPQSKNGWGQTMTIIPTSLTKIAKKYQSCIDD